MTVNKLCAAEKLLSGNQRAFNRVGPSLLLYVRHFDWHAVVHRKLHKLGVENQYATFRVVF